MNHIDYMHDLNEKVVLISIKLTFFLIIYFKYLYNLKIFDVNY
jgi:hypothetical protein